MDFAAGLQAASVAEYLFRGPVCGPRICLSPRPDSAGNPKGGVSVENLWIVGITPARASG